MPKCPNCGRNVDSSYQAQCSHCGAGLAMAPTGVPSTHTDLFGIPQGVSDPPAMPVPSSQDQPNKAGKVAKRFGAATVVRVAIVLVVLGGGAVWNWFTGARRDDSGAITDAGGLDVFRMAVGDCLDWPGGSDSEATEVERVEGKPCSEPHDLEVYALIDHPASAGDPYPGDDAVYTWGVEQCLPLFTGYVGASYENVADLDISVFYPTTQSWKQQADREVVCMINDIDGGQLVRSVKGREA